MKVFAIAESAQELKGLCAGARSLADRVEAVFVTADAAEAAAIDTAEKVWVVPARSLFEDCVETVAAIVEAQAPDMLLAAATVRMRLVAGRVAAKLGTSVIAGATGYADGFFTRTMYGGAGVARVRACGPLTVATVSPGALEPVEFACVPEVETVEHVGPVAGIELVESIEKPRQSVDLTKAARVIGVGRGIKAEEDLQMVRELADAINAEIGCTRPISEGEKWMPRETYIGVSGLVLKPEIYIALGISGQIQHTFGVNGSKVFIAVDRNPDAMIFDCADYGIVGDLYKVVPQLIAALR